MMMMMIIIIIIIVVIMMDSNVEAANYIRRKSITLLLTHTYC